MNISWWSKWRGTPRQVSRERPIEDLLDAEVRRTHEVDPGTARQWAALHAALGNTRSTAIIHYRTRRKQWAWAAVSFALVAGAVMVAVLFRMPQTDFLTYDTGKGRQASILLADSSEVSLNHTSELVVEPQAPGTARRVVLRGEAFFRVRKSGTPFIVSTDVGRVQVLGTEFNVAVRDGLLVVAVVRGSVRVSVQRDDRDSAVVLTANQISACASDGFPGSPAQLPFSEYPGWLHGKVLLYRTTLRAACQEIESQFDVVVKVENDRLRDQTITGAVDARSAEAAVSTLARLTGASYRHESNDYILH